jgi:hypothetical protein
MFARVAAVAGALLLLGLPSLAAAVVPVGITVSEGDGIARRQWPLSLSIPLPRGALRPDRPVSIVDASGGAAPVQARPLVRWSDGSVRWLLVDTVTDLAPHQTRHLRLVAGRSHAPAVRATAVDSPAGVVVDTGTVRFIVPRTRFAFVDALRPRDGQTPAIGAVTSTLVADGDTHAAQTPSEVRIVDAGPLRVRVDVRGTYGSGFDYEIRIEAYAGQPVVHIWHTFINRHPVPYSSVSSLNVELPLSAPMSDYRYGAVGTDPVAGALGDGGLQLAQIDNETFARDGTTRPGRLSGWVELSGGSTRAGLAARWFWQEYPQNLDVQRDRLVYSEWAPTSEPAKFGVGAAVTHEFAIWAGAAAGGNSDIAEVAAAPLLGVVDPAALASSGALPQAIAPRAAGARFAQTALAAARRYESRNAIERWDDCGSIRCDTGVERPRTGAYGMLNWGDWNFIGYHDTTKGIEAWGNLEYDTAEVLALTYAATGDAAVHEMMVAAARHFIDVDTIHACPARPKWVGMNHPKNPLHFAFELGGPDLGHTWTQGSLAYYYLTGDERGLVAARGVADYLVERVRTVNRGNPRQWGWPQIALLAVFDATGHAAYRDAALAYARGGMRAHPPATSTQWKVGILADALAYTHAATGDPEIAAWLKAYAAAVMQRRADADARAFPGVAYVAAMTGNAAMREAAQDRVDQLDLGNWGKPYSVNGRIGFRIESLLAGKPPPRHRKPVHPPSRANTHGRRR